jgi:Protein of unknown function (DUF3106)
MAFIHQISARPLRAVYFSALLMSISSIIHANPDIASVPLTTIPGTSAVNNTATITSKSAIRPLWVELTPVQQQALAPLSTEWDKIDATRKKKWLEIGNGFTSKKPEEQARIQERMREWVKLTPEQRHTARESYARTKKLSSDQKTAQWQQYQQLPEEQKKKLAADSASKKHVATLPPASQAKVKSIPPIKSTHKASLESSIPATQTSSLIAVPQIPLSPSSQPSPLPPAAK